MSREELVTAFSERRISRRIFIAGMVAAGVSALTALSYANALENVARDRGRMRLGPRYPGGGLYVSYGDYGDYGGGGDYDYGDYGDDYGDYGDDDTGGGDYGDYGDYGDDGHGRGSGDVPRGKGPPPGRPPHGGHPPGDPPSGTPPGSDPPGGGRGRP
jgi:hypothetical protein